MAFATFSDLEEIIEPCCNVMVVHGMKLQLNIGNRSVKVYMKIIAK